MSHSLMLCGMIELVPDSHSMTDGAAMNVIIGDVLQKSVALNNFIEHLIIVLAERHHLTPGAMEEVATIDTHDTINTFKIPPLLRS